MTDIQNEGRFLTRYKTIDDIRFFFNKTGIRNREALSKAYDNLEQARHTFYPNGNYSTAASYLRKASRNLFWGLRPIEWLATAAVAGVGIAALINNLKSKNGN